MIATEAPHVYNSEDDRCCCGNVWCKGCETCSLHCQCTRLVRVPGVGPDAPTVTNPRGGRQSDSPYALDALPFRAVLGVAKVLKHGKTQYGKDNWRLIERWEHINHALAHIMAFGAGDKSDDHLEHAACRILFALETTDEITHVA